MSELRAFDPHGVDRVDGDPGPLVQDGEIVICGPIEAGGRNSAAAIRAALTELPDEEEVRVRLDSRGGHFDEGLACYLALGGARKRIVVTIDGEASSAASLIAAAGNEVLITETGSILIHEVTTRASGGMLALRQAAEGLDRSNGMAVDILARRTRQDRSVIELWAARETVFTGAAAVEAGLADRVVPDRRSYACPCCGRSG
jgi:ATP-dependent protease ClpP protease subunit